MREKAGDMHTSQSVQPGKKITGSPPMAAGRCKMQKNILTLIKLYHFCTLQSRKKAAKIAASGLFKLLTLGL